MGITDGMSFSQDPNGLKLSDVVKGAVDQEINTQRALAGNNTPTTAVQVIKTKVAGAFKGKSADVAARNPGDPNYWQGLVSRNKIELSDEEKARMALDGPRRG